MMVLLERAAAARTAVVAEADVEAVAEEISFNSVAVIMPYKIEAYIRKKESFTIERLFFWRLMFVIVL